MSVENGDFVTIEYTGRVKETGAIFSTSDEETAKKADLWDKKTTFGAVPIIAGERFLLPGLDRQIVGLAVGEQQTLVVPAEEAYGQRQSDLIRSYPARLVKESGIKMARGENIRDKIQGQDMTGTIVDIKHGKVKVDFNHEMAGQDLEFDVRVVEKVEGERERMAFLFSRFVPRFKADDLTYKVDPEDKTSVDIELPPFMLLSEGVGQMLIRVIGDLRHHLQFEKIDFHFQFDFSQVAKAEQELAEIQDQPVEGEEATAAPESEGDEPQEKSESESEPESDQADE